jgi:hypothetical protein
VTPDLSGQSRGAEILAWLKGRDEVERFAVIDDEDDDLDDLPLFQPKRSKGLTEDMAQQVENYLSGKSDQDMRLGRLYRLLQRLSAAWRRHPG